MKNASKTQEQINAFMEEYQALVEKHGIELHGEWADSYYLEVTETGETIAQEIDMVNFKATLYVEPLPMHGPRENKPPMSLSDMAKVIGSVYKPPLADSLTSNSTFMDKMRYDINRQIFGADPRGNKDE